MNKFFKGRNLVIGLLTLAFGVIIAVGIGKVWANQTTTVTGNVAWFMLNREGKVDGVILDTSDQIKFGAETGEFVASNVQIGTSLTATGHAGTSSNYGREFHAQTLQIGDQTINIARADKGGKGEKGDKPKDGRGKRRGPKDGEKPVPPAEMNEEIAPDANRPQAETSKVGGTVKYVLVNKDGNPRGVILAGGEQLNLGREVEQAGLTFDQNTQIGAEGKIVESRFGKFVKAQTLTVGNQTFTFNR